MIVKKTVLYVLHFTEVLRWFEITKQKEENTPKLLGCAHNSYLVIS